MVCNIFLYNLKQLDSLSDKAALPVICQGWHLTDIEKTLASPHDFTKKVRLWLIKHATCTKPGEWVVLPLCV